MRTATRRREMDDTFITNTHSGESAEQTAARERRSLDPAISLPDAAAAHIGQIVQNLTNQAKIELRRFRDETDGLMIGLDRRHDAIMASIEEHRDNVAAVLESKTIMVEHLAKLKELFEPGAVVTQLKNGDGR